jgi:trans-aconitate 2-methyltransferase
LRVLTPTAYALLLDRLGFEEQQVLLKVYGHHLASRDAVVDWMKGTLLTAYEQRLPPELFARFVAEYARRLLPQLEDRRPFLYPFERILLWAARP